MRKLRSLIAAVLVVLIQITPGPLGLRPVEASPAILVPVAVGALLSATMVAGAGVYSNPSANFAIDSVTGAITTGVIVAKMIGVGAEQAAYGFAHNLLLDFDKCVDWAKSHTSDFPLFNAALATATPSASGNPVPGNIYSSPSGNLQLLTLGTPVVIPNEGYASSYGTPAQYIAALGYIQTGFGMSNGSVVLWNLQSMPDNDSFPALHFMSYSYAPYTAQSTAEPITPPVAPGAISIPAFISAYSHSPETQAEIDKLIFGNPAVVIPSSIPTAITPAQIGTAVKDIEVGVRQKELDRLRDIAANDPTNVPAQIAVEEAEGRLEIAQAELAGEVANVENETEVPPDIPYNPSALDGPYTLPEVDFGQRLKDFVTTVKGTSIFSLPNSVFGGIPGAGNSQMTINGGQIFGTHIFDFADLSSMWVVLRGIVLTGFSFIAVRIVCLKK